MIPVIGVHGLAQLQHDEVRDIDDIGDGVQSDQRKTPLHPCRRLFDLHIVNIAAQESLAEFRSLDPDMESRELFVRLGEVEGRLLHRLVQHCCHFAGDAENALAVRAVRGDGDVKKPVVQADDGLHVGTHGSVVRKDQQSVVACAGIQILGDTELHAGAEHALGFIAPQLSFLDGHHAFHCLVILCGGVDRGAHQRRRELLSCFHIVRAAADLEGSVRSAVDSADMKVCLRDGFTGLHKTHHHVGDILSYLSQFFHFKSAGKQLVLQLLRSAVDIDIIL